MTNPNNAIGTNGAFDGRTSPNALNDLAAAFTRGIVSGWNCEPKSGMTVQLGGSASVRDVALAEDNAGDKLTINNRSGAPVEITLDGAPATNNRVDAIVAYVDNPSTGDGNTTDNPTACGIIAVSGTVAANPTEPTEAQIRSAITTDGATGGVAYYVVLATIRVGTSVTSIGSGVITQGTPVQSIAETGNIADGSVTSEKVDWTTLLPSNFVALESASQGWTVFSIGRLKFIWKQITQSSNGWKDFGQIPDECVGSSMIMFQWTSLYGNNATGYSAAAQISGGHIFAQVQGINNSNGGWAFAIFA